MQNPELDANILALEIQLNYYEKLLDQSIGNNEIFAKSKMVYRDLKEISSRLEFLRKQNATELNQNPCGGNV